MYINCKTYFSFHYGTFATEELVKAGVEAGATELALTNINSTCDAWDFVQYCRQQNIKPILGVEIRNGHKLLYILLAKTSQRPEYPVFGSTPCMLGPLSLMLRLSTYWAY